MAQFFHGVLEFARHNLDLIALFLSVVAIFFAGNQFFDAREHKRALVTITDSLRQAADLIDRSSRSMQDSIGNINENVGAVGENIKQTETAVTNIRQEAGQLQQTISALNASVHSLEGSVETVKAQSSTIKEAVVTLPSRTFLRDFCKRMTTIRTISMSVLRRSASRQELEELIRVLLEMVAALAYSYDQTVRR